MSRGKALWRLDFAIAGSVVESLRFAGEKRSQLAASSTYRSGRSPDWLKNKNPACEAVRREEEEDWGR